MSEIDSAARPAIPPKIPAGLGEPSRSWAQARKPRARRSIFSETLRMDEVTMIKKRKRRASAKALAVNPDTIDPTAILRAIAANDAAPATARVAACRALLLAARPGSEPAQAEDDPVSRRAIILLGG